MLLLFFLCGRVGFLFGQEQGLPAIADKVDGMEAYSGFFDFYWDPGKGEIWLVVDKINQEFIYVNSLSAGIGSNDIGLDRNQLGDTRIVLFRRVGPKLLLEQPNYRYRAESDNALERQSVREAFARSVLAGFKIEAESDEAVLINLTSFLLRDAHGVAGRLKQRKQGNYKVDKSRSAIHLERSKAFPKNTDFDAIITFEGSPAGGMIRSVTPTPSALTVNMHHSFVELPGPGFEPRAFDPRCGYFPNSYFDYATPIDQPLEKHLIYRHRLGKKNPEAAISEPVEPIIYYLDPGTPEPVRSALLEGARWWNQAFEAAGYRDAFRVEMLPKGADPMDVRYNVINWVHRSTRGWSYGSMVADPRTGEIIKGHVLLGSLRVRQDFLLAQGLVEAYAAGKIPDPRLQAMALARLRQLSAHEVGHTLGLAHNFAASTDDRASVMDYPHPFIQLDEKGKMDFSQAYDTGIGAWDKRAIQYGYQDFTEGTDESEALKAILNENDAMGLYYITDRDARPAYGAHPLAHLWDNGKSAVAELYRLGRMRRQALDRFGEKNIPEGSPMGQLERVLAPLYLSHRYQVEAVSKMVGGVEYNYAMRGDTGEVVKPVDPAVQREAIEALLETVEPDYLMIPEDVIGLIPPQPPGYTRDRELFKTYTGMGFDPLAAAEAAATHTLAFMLNPQRLSRLIAQHAQDDSYPSPYEVMRLAAESVRADQRQGGLDAEIARAVEKVFVHHVLQLAGDRDINRQVAATAWQVAQELENELEGRARRTPALEAHIAYLQREIQQFKADPLRYKLPAIPDLPDGSPIGCGY